MNSMEQQDRIPPNLGDNRATSNWKNVNNWHWVDKDSLPWASSFVTRQLGDLKVEEGDLCGTVDSINSVKGDSVVNQRKGKFTCVFDLEIKGSWTLKSKSGSKETVKGEFETVEFAYDTDIPNIEINFTPGEGAQLDAESEQFLKGCFSKAIGKKLEGFVNEMIDENYKHIFVQDIDKPKHDGGAIESTKSDKADNTGKSTVSQVVNFSASPMDLFECLTDINRIEAWSRCAAELSAVPGGLFNLLNGRISGKFQELIPGEKIVQKWRLNSWDADHYSKVSITIAPSDTGSTLTVTQSSIPSGHHSSMSENWSRFYWWPIRDTFGFGCTIE